MRQQLVRRRERWDAKRLNFRLDVNETSERLTMTREDMISLSRRVHEKFPEANIKVFVQVENDLSTLKKKICKGWTI